MKPSPMLALLAALTVAATSFVGQAQVVVWPANGHGYQRVDSGRITWADARAAAEAAVADGRPGHLATINSAEENRFLTDHALLGNGAAGQMDGYWLGGYQPAGSPEPAGGWRWVTGEPFAFANWAGGEPNNMNGLENALVFWAPSDFNGRLWNDSYERTTYAGEGVGYVIEYEITARPPEIAQQPQDQSVVTGATVLMEIGVEGQTPLYYQWQKDGNALLEGGRISGVRTARLRLANVLIEDAGLYSVIVTNQFGSAASRPARLAVSGEVPGGNEYRIGLSFGADQANASLAPAAVAGVSWARQANWNNLRGPGGSSSTILADDAGTAVATPVTVTWQSNNTWASTGRGGDENNGFTGPDRILMTGYLDTGAPSTTTVMIRGLPPRLTTSGYTVILYVLGGQTQRGGGYRILAADTPQVLTDVLLGDSPAAPSAYTRDPGVSHQDVGTCLLFEGLTARDIVVEATTGNGLGYGTLPRAPLNALQFLPSEASSDVTPPTLVRVSGDNTLTRATLRFSEALGVLSATNTANYRFVGSVRVLRATLEANGTTVVLHTTPQSPVTAYTVTVNHVADLAGNWIAPGSQRSFTSGEAAALGQFTFANKNRATVPPIDARVYGINCATPLAGDAYWAQAYAKRAVESDDRYVPVGAPVHFRTGANAGYIVPVVVTTPFPGGTETEVQMRVWETACGDTFEAARDEGCDYSFSNPVRVTVATAPNLPQDMIGLQSFCTRYPPPIPPSITAEPTDVRVAIGSACGLEVSATGAPWWLSYQWFHDGRPIVGQQDSALNVASARLADGGAYHVTVTNHWGGATSRVAHVVVGYPLLLVTNGPGRIEVKPAFWIQEPGQQVVLTAIPEKGHAFQGWQGDLAGTINPATLVMDGTKQVHAWFQRDTSRLKWQVATGGALLSCPAIGRDGTVYVPAGRTVLALDGASGATHWSVPLDCLPHESLALGADGTVYVGSWDRKVYALDAASGAQKWAYQTINTVETSPAVRADGTVIVGCSNLLGQATITALDGGQGSRRWEFVTGTPGRASLSLGAQGTVYVTAGTNLFALDGQQGTALWVAGGTNYLADAPAIGADDTVYVKAWDGRLYARDGSTGAPRWASGVLGVGPGGPAIGFDGTIFLGASSTVFALNATNGGVRWQFAADGSVEGTPAVAADNTICVMSTSGTLYALDGATGAEKWRFITGSRLWGSPAIGADGTVYVGADDGTLYAVQGSRGLAATPWPKFHRDAQNTGQAPAEPPALLPQPFLAVLAEGAEDWITVRFSGTPAPQIQWYFHGAPVPGGTNEALVFASVTRAFEGLYWAAASNWLGQATSAPMVAVVSNVDPAYYPGWRWEGGGGAVQVLASRSIFGPWTQLFTPPAGATSGYYIETNLESPSLYYQLREEGGGATAKFTATAHVPGWWYEEAAGTRHRVEYVWEGSGWTNWMGLTELTPPEGPHLFLDTDAFDHPGAVYRSTPVP